jgi:hypothetical protein
MYQNYRNTGNETYRPTEQVIEEAGTLYGNYRPITSGAKKTDYSSYGLNAGFRIFFGEKRDVDGDGIADAQDRCKLEYGEIRFNGCPDRDHDNIADGDDACPDSAEDKDVFQDEDGCPDADNDADGVSDTSDKCPLDPEDRDAFQDEDGCPDLHDDDDRLLRRARPLPKSSGVLRPARL